MTRDITVTFATLFVSISSKSKAINVFRKHSEIKCAWPINSSKQEIVLLRDDKELFVQRFVIVFDQNRKHVEMQNQRTGTPANFTLPYRTVRSSHQRCCIRKLFLNNFAISTGNTCAGVFFFKNLQTFRLATLLKRDPNTGVFLWILQNF